MEVPEREEAPVEPQDPQRVLPADPFGLRAPTPTGASARPSVASTPSTQDDPFALRRPRRVAGGPPFAPTQPLTPVALLEDANNPFASQDPLQQALRVGRTIPSAHAARVLTLQKSTGLPLDVVNTGLPEVEQQIGEQAVDPFLFQRLSPVLADYAARHPVNASVVQADLRQMSAIEAVSTAIRRGWESGKGQSRAFKAQLAMSERIFAGEDVSPLERYIRDANVERASAAPTGMNLLEESLFTAYQFTGQMAKMAPDMAGGAAIGALAGAATAAAGLSAGAPLAIIGLYAGFGARGGVLKSAAEMEAGATYYALNQLPNAEAIPEGTKRATAYGAGFLKGVIELVALEKIGGMIAAPIAKRFFSKATGDMLVRPTTRQAFVELGKAIAGPMVLEPSQELAQELVDVAAEEFAKISSNGQFETLSNSPELREATIQRLTDVVVQTFKGMLILGPVGGSLGMSAHLMQAERATKQVQSWEKLGEAIAAASPASVESGAAADVAAQAMGNGNVFVDVDRFQVYFQKEGVDPREAAREIWGDTSAYDEAVQTGQSLEMPVKVYAQKIAGTPANAYFAKEVRPDPETMNGREADALLQNAEQLHADRAAEIDAQAPVDAERQALEDQIATDLEATGRYRSADVRPQAQTLARFYASVARTMGGESTPANIAARFPLKIRDTAPPTGIAGRSLKQSGIQPDVLLSKERLAELDDKYAAALAANDRYEMRRLVMEAAQVKLVDSSQNLEGHRPAGPEEGAPLYDLTLVYPDDIYGPNGLRYYNTGDDKIDNAAYAIVQAMRDKPNVEVKVYRAIAPQDKAVISPGDWVTTVRNYAKGHGESTLHGEYKIVSKTVHARDIYTSGDSWAEWGYHPQERLPSTVSYTGPLDARRALTLTERFGKTSLEQATRGSITFGAGGEFNIALLEQANLSTFLHETGHYYLEVLGTLATESPTLAQDYATILKEIGAQPGKSITREQHERFANLLLDYFKEGKAPAASLRAAFSRFRAWLLALYHTATASDINLSDEVRGVFDRMFATEQEITIAQREADLAPLFTDATTAGMSEAEFALYRETVTRAREAAVEELSGKLIRQQQREAKKWWQEAMADVREDVTAEVSAMQVYQTIDGLRRRVDPDDATVAGNEPRLDRAQVVALKGEESLASLRGLNIVVRSGGRNLMQAAEEFGYDSPDAMLTAISQAQPRRQLIEQMTAARMKEQYGDMVTDGTLAEAARAAVINSDQSDILRAEMRALNKLARTVKPFVEQAKDEGEAQQTAAEREREYERRWMDAERKVLTAIAVGKKQVEIDALREEARTAKEATKEGRKQFRAGIPTQQFLRQVAAERVAQAKISKLQPQVYWAAARKAARLAASHLAKQEYDLALNAKTQELLNQELYRATVKAKEEADAAHEFAQKLQTKEKQGKIGKAGFTYLDQINAILERFDFRTISNVAARKRQSMAGFIEEQKALNLPIDIPEALQNEAFRMPWREMTVEQLRGVIDTLKHINHLAMFKNKLLKEAAQRTLEEQRALLTESIIEHARKTRPFELGDGDLPTDKTKRLVDDIFSSHRKLSSYIRVMDGFAPGGVMQQMIMRPLNEASAAQSEFNARAAERLEEIFGRYTHAEQAAMYQKRMVAGFGASVSKMQALMMALNMGTEDNATKLAAGLTLEMGREIGPEQIGAVLNTLDQRDWAFVQDVWQFINSYWPEMKALSERLSGIAPAKIEGQKVPTRFGEIQGQYFPLMYNHSKSTLEAHDRLAVTAEELKVGNARKKATTKAGSRNERVAGVRSPLRLDFGVISEHVADISMDLTHTETLIDVGRILQGQEVKAAIRQHYGDTVYQQIMGTVDAIAQGQVPPLTKFDAVMNHVRTGSTVVGLGWNLTTALLQPLGMLNGMVYAGGPVQMLRALGEITGDAAKLESTVSWITEKSLMMKHRVTTQTRETTEVMQQAGFSQGMVDALVASGVDKVTLGKLDMNDVTQSFFWLITRMQLMADVPTWLAAYRNAWESAPTGEMDDAKAVSIADQAVLNAQGGGAVKDLASIQRGHVWLKLFTNFYSYMNLVMNQMSEAFAQLDIKKPASVGRFAADVLLVAILPTVLSWEIRRMMRGTDDEEPSDLIISLAREFGALMFGMFVGLREIGGAVNGFKGYEGPAGTRAFAGSSKLITEISQWRLDRGLWKALNSTAGTILHYPAGQLQRTIDGFFALLDDRTNNPMALIVGPPKR